jgi:uncharacterized protein YciI
LLQLRETAAPFFAMCDTVFAFGDMAARAGAALRELSSAERSVHRQAMKHFLLFYEAGPDYLERRPQFREAHLQHAWDAVERGEIVIAGALADPVDGAVLMFAGEDRSVAERFAEVDPYVTNGLVAHWHVREWTTVVGEIAATPVRPEDA